jgi:hypothetical protein
MYNGLKYEKEEGEEEGLPGVNRSISHTKAYH